MTASRITAMEYQVLSLIGDGYDTGDKLARKTGRAPRGCSRTAASLVRKRWAERRATKPTEYKLTAAGASQLSFCARYPHMIGGKL